MSDPVFISYAHGSTVAAARALRDRLQAAGREVFLDEAAIAYGSAFPRRIADGLCAARVVVVLADPLYFSRPWCVFEYLAIVAASRAAAGDPALAPDQVVVALPAGREAARVVPHLPPRLARSNWPAIDDVATLAGLVEERLARRPPRLGELLAGSGEVVVAQLAGGADIPLAWAPEARTAEPGARPFAWLGTLPESRGQAFCGRGEALAAVFRELVTCRPFSRARSCAVEGPGGSGKSQLAAEFVARYGRDFFPGGTVWISAEGDAGTLAAQFAGLLAAEGVAPPPVGDDESDEVVLARLAQALQRHFETRPWGGDVLWVVDGIPEPGRGRPARIERWCPAHGGVALLATTRRSQLEGMHAAVKLGALERAEAVAWLTRPPVEAAWLAAHEWEDLADWVGGLPLAIDVLHRSLADGYASAAALRRARSEEPAVELDRIMEALREDVADERLRGVAEAFEFSWQALAADGALGEAATLAAQLGPYALPDSLLDSLLPATLRGRLAKRGWLQPVGGSGERRWQMHRIPASFVRGRALDPEAQLARVFHWLGGLAGAPGLAREQRAVGYQLLVLQRRAGRLAAQGASAGLLAAAGECALALGNAGAGEDLRGLRSLAAGLAAAVGVGEALALRLAGLAESADEARRAALPHSLQALHGSPTAIALMTRLLDDPSAPVRWQAAVHAGALGAAELAEPLLAALLGGCAEVDAAVLDPFVDAAAPTLRPLLSRLAAHLGDARAEVRRRAAELAGRVLVANPGDFRAGGFTRRQVLGALLRLALEDADTAVADAALEAATARFEPLGLELMQDALAAATGPAGRQRLVRRYADWLRSSQRPPPPAGRAEWLEEGGLRLHLDFGQAVAVPPGAFAPLIEAASGSDVECARLAAHALLNTDASRRAVLDEAYRLLDDGRYDPLLALAAALLAEQPDFSSAYWWRAQVFEARGDEAEAIAALQQVCRLSPGFAQAWLMLGRLLCHRQAFAEALPALEAAARCDASLTIAHHLSALCLYNLERWADAEAAAGRAIALSPQIGEAWFFRAIARSAAGRQDEAFEDLRRAAELSPEDERILAFRDELAAWLAGRPA